MVDPTWGSGAWGMEHPALFTAGTRLFNPLAVAPFFHPVRDDPRYDALLLRIGLAG